MWDLEKFSNNIAIIDEAGEKLSYKDLSKVSSLLGEAVGGRSLCFILCTNTIGSIIGYVSLVNNGIVPLLLSFHMERLLLDNLINLYKPQFIYLPSSARDEFPDFPEIYSGHGYSLIELGFSKEELFPLNESLALLLTTSGSTGSPKLVRQSYKNIASNTESIIEYLGIKEDERAITTLPMNYTYGLSIINTHLYAGATILVTEKGLMQKEFWDFFEREGATSFGGVPYTYEMLNKLKVTRMKLPSLRYMTQAGGKLSPTLHETFAKYAEDLGKRFIVMYGQCEATARMGYLPPEKAMEKKGSMGIAIPGGKLWLRGEDGTEISEPLVAGELIYEGPNVTMGYAESGEDLSLGDLRGGVLETGDIAEFDQDGFFYIVGRKKRFLKIYGNRVNLDEVERHIRERFGIEAASAGVDDHLKIFITDGRDGEKIKTYISDITKLNPAAFEIRVISEIPKNESGKVLYSVLEGENK
ncbi:MAG: AMP-binding protein [Lachnospiraceae bacterium]|nr:AMP-binding protein [Lachnospiraceae bacterium]